MSVVYGLAAAGMTVACGPSRSLPAYQGQPAPPPVETLDGGDDGAAQSDGADGSAPDGADDASADGDAGQQSDAPPAFPSACSPAAAWTTIARVPSIAPADFGRFGAISANVLTVAWTSTAGGIYVADRSSAQDAFGTPAILDSGTIPLANDRVALAPTGMEIVATLADRSSFVSFYRTSVSGSWAPTGSKEFATIAAMRSESGGTFSEPVVSADGDSLFYLLALGGANEAPVLYESQWDASVREWGTGAPLPNPEFGSANATQLRRPTGAASDRRTLFFFDEVAAHERAAWRASPTSPFTMFEDLPSLPEAAPSDDCTTLYFQGQDATGPGLFAATATSR